MADDVVKIAGYVSISREIAEDFRLIKEALSAPVSPEAWAAWLAEDDDDWDWDDDELIDGQDLGGGEAVPHSQYDVRGSASPEQIDGDGCGPRPAEETRGDEGQPTIS